jgi:transketolase
VIKAHYVYFVRLQLVMLMGQHCASLVIFLINYIHYIFFCKVATRNAYGTALVKIGETCDRVVALDCDVKNSTFSITFKKAFPDRFIECFIAEQNMVGVGVGCATRGRTIPFVSTFACFLSRGYDQIRMAGVSNSAVNFCGSHVGCSIGKISLTLALINDVSIDE